MLCLISNRKSIRHGSLEDLVHTIKRTHVDRFILREKDMTVEELLNQSQGLKQALADSTTQFLINTHVDVAREVGAHGVHFPFEVFKNTKERYGLTGVSVHSVEEARFAEANGADYLIAGHVYTTQCKDGLAPRGLIYLKEVCQAVTIPVIAIGGIKPIYIPEVMAQGAKGVAVMSTINHAMNPVQKIFEYQAALQIIR